MTERKRLIELVKQSLIKHIDKTCNLAENITEDLLANGVIVPPVKIGDTVYDYAVRECRVISVHFYDEGLPAFTVERTGYHGVKIYTTYTFNKIGESVFLTREEAEKELEERGKS